MAVAIEPKLRKGSPSGSSEGTTVSRPPDRPLFFTLRRIEDRVFSIPQDYKERKKVKKIWHEILYNSYI